MYIPKGYLPYIFGEDHNDITINFGGKNIYAFDANGNATTKLNEYFLDDIFDSKISLLSCLVGGNGGGKTTLLKLILNSYHCIYVIEKLDGSYELTQGLGQFHRIYYTPYLNHDILDSVGDNGKELSKVAMIKTDNHGDSGLLEDFLNTHHSENGKRWIKFNNFLRKNQAVKTSIPVFQRVELTLEHFDYNIHNPDKFHDTSYQLRAPISLLIEKIKTEKAIKEHEHFLAKGDENDKKDLSYFKVRFEYALYETILGKLVSILERAGNHYLDEGTIPDDYELQINNLDVRSGFEWFLRNSGVFSGDENYTFSQHLNMLDLIDYVRSLITPENLTDNWLKIIITEQEALKIIELADAFNNSFVNEWFRFDRKPIFSFIPQIFISSGEQQFLNLFSTLYYHSQNIKDGIDIDPHSFDSLKYIKKDILLLLDEGDNAFHPQWKKEYIKNLRTIIPLIFDHFNIQIIITSHDPLTLSDIPKNNIIFLERGANGILLGDSSTKHTFGANISDLLKDSFFLSDGQIGNYVAEIINFAIALIKQGHFDLQSSEVLERIIRTIDEPIIKFKLAEMLSEATGNNDFERALLDNEISRLQEKRKSI